MDDRQSADLPLPIEVIFSCAVCQATMYDIYGKQVEDDGNHKTAESQHAVHTTKLWLTECRHLTCSKHLDGGGVPFYAADDRPRAACPVCTVERGDSTKKTLFGIRGCIKGSYHPGIPAVWFETPPINLESTNEGMSALNFHYISLIRFSTHLLANYRGKVSALADAESHKRAAETKQQKLETEVEALKSRLSELEICEKELRPWKQREHKIRHYLGVLTEVTRENEKLREQMTAMGYAVPIRKLDLSNDSTSTALDRMDDQIPKPLNSNKMQKRTSTRSEPSSQQEQSVTRNATGSSRTLTGHPEPMINSDIDDAESGMRQKRKSLQNSSPTRDDLHRSTMHSTVDNDGARQLPSVLRGSINHIHNINNNGLDQRRGPRSMNVPDQIRSAGANEHQEDIPTQSTGAYLQTGSTSTANIMIPEGNRIEASLLNQHTSSSRHEDVHPEEIPYGLMGQWNSGGQQVDNRARHFAQFPPPHGVYGYEDKAEVLESDTNRQRQEVHGSSNSSRNFRLPQEHSRAATYRSLVVDHSSQQFDPARHAIFASQLPHDATNTQTFSYLEHQPYPTPKTPSPLKNMFVPQNDSVASPFFNKSSKSERSARLTLPSRAVKQQNSSRHMEPLDLPGRRDKEDSFLMPPPPKPVPPRRFENHGAPYASQGPIHGEAPYSCTNYSSAFPEPPMTPTHPVSYAPATPRNADGLFQRPDYQQQFHTYNSVGSVTPHHFQGHQLTASHSPAQSWTPWRREIPPPLPSTPSVSPPVNGSSRHQHTSPTRGLYSSTSTAGQPPAFFPPQFPGRPGHNNTSTWQDMSGSRSGISRLSREPYPKHAAVQQASGRRSVRR